MGGRGGRNWCVQLVYNKDARTNKPDRLDRRITTSAVPPSLAHISMAWPSTISWSSGWLLVVGGVCPPSPRASASERAVDEKSFHRKLPTSNSFETVSDYSFFALVSRFPGCRRATEPALGDIRWICHPLPTSCCHATPRPSSTFRLLQWLTGNSFRKLEIFRP